MSRGSCGLRDVPTFRARPLKADIPARKLTSDNNFSTVLGLISTNEQARTLTMIMYSNFRLTTTRANSQKPQ
jgi:hypothetical protein